ncbi:MAG: FeoB-associated Cys-rich membrane protein [Bacteroidales bacterium]|nr:FeoB-associated Cys-rich membrane protein [Bacteroidales bacterium]
MTQLILTIITVAVAAVYAIFKIYRRLFRDESPCEGCASDCSSCQLKDLMEDSGIAK